MKDPKVDAYIHDAGEFAQPILHHLRDLVHAAAPDIEEGLKWGMPYFTHQGSLLCFMAAFKKHCAFRFWDGKLMEDPEGILLDVGKSNMMDIGKISSLEDLPAEEVLSRYVANALAVAKTGEKPKKASRSTAEVPPMPDDLAAALQENDAARATFEGFSNSNKKEYVEWLTDAKTEKTRLKRLATAIEWMAEGKVRNWKYIKK